MTSPPRRRKTSARREPPLGAPRQPRGGLRAQNQTAIYTLVIPTLLHTCHMVFHTRGTQVEAGMPKSRPWLERLSRNGGCPPRSPQALSVGEGRPVRLAFGVRRSGLEEGGGFMFVRLKTFADSTRPRTSAKPRSEESVARGP